MAYANNDLKINEVITDQLNALGHRAWIVSSQDSSISKADMLLLAGDGRGFNNFKEHLKKINGKKPFVILWQFDPLAPPVINSETEKSILKLGTLDWGRLGYKTSKVIRKSLFFSGKVWKLIIWFLSYRIKKRVCKNHTIIFSRTSSIDLFSSCASYRYIKENVTENWIDLLVVSTAAKKVLLGNKNIQNIHIPIGYDRRWGRQMQSERDIDVLFFGNLYSSRRKKILKNVFEKLKKANITLKVVDSHCYGSRRTELLNRTKIILDISRVPWDYAGLRFLMSMSCGALVVSETVVYPEPYKPNVHFVHGPIEELPDLILYYLNDEIERNKITRSAHSFVTEKISMASMLEKIINIKSPA